MTNFQKILGIIAIAVYTVIVIKLTLLVSKTEVIVEIYPQDTNKNIIVDSVVKADSLELSGIIGTYYNPVPEQCDNSPLITADGSKIDLDKLKNREIRWVALSRDLLKRWGGPLDHGDTITITHNNPAINGKWVVHDCMNRRYKKRMDFLVALGNKFPGKTRDITIKKEI
jgi:hypothetical protein